MFKSVKLFLTKTLKRELIIAIVVTHAIMMGLFIYDLTNRQAEFLHKQSLSQAKSLTRTLADNATTWVMANDYVGMFEIVQSISKYPSLKYAMLIDNDGKILAHTNKNLLNKFLSGKLAQKVINSKKDLLTLINNDNIIDIAVSIKVDKRQIGWARIGLSQETNAQGLNVVFEQGMVYTVAAIFVGWIFAYILAIGFTKSLYKIIAIAKQTASGNRGLQIHTTRNDEIGILSQELNIMFLELEENDNIVNDFNKSLEEEIFSKTKSLATKNLELEENELKLKTLNESLEEQIHLEVTKIKKIQEQLYRSEKLSAMGDMIGNIAHQWRQPLSVITTAATGMQMQKEYGKLTDDVFNEACELINNNAQYLSNTINDFKNFIKGDNENIEFTLKENIESLMHLVESVAKIENIQFVINLEDNIVMNGHPNELLQCLVNICNNAKDAFVEQKISKKYIFISTKISNDNVKIIIRDNAGGILPEVQEKIFEPYFTTKHQSQGTGLGLSMTYNLITEGMHGNIDIETLEYEYKNEIYKGAEFTMTLPLGNTLKV